MNIDKGQALTILDKYSYFLVMIGQCWLVFFLNKYYLRIGNFGYFYILVCGERLILVKVDKIFCFTLEVWDKSFL